MEPLPHRQSRPVFLYGMNNEHPFMHSDGSGMTTSDTARKLILVEFMVGSTSCRQLDHLEHLVRFACERINAGDIAAVEVSPLFPKVSYRPSIENFRENR
jgi:hypothetical protein